MKIHYCDEVENIDLFALRKSIKKNTFAVIRGLFDENKIITKKKLYIDTFDYKNDIKHNPEDIHLAKTNLQKIVIGNEGGTWRFYRKLYTPLFKEDKYHMHYEFKKLIKLRNILSGRKTTFAPEGTWTCPMITHYPTGGGFLAKHRDVADNLHATDLGINFIQIIFIMSQKGIDFQTGGAYVIHNGETIYIEDECRPGDVVLYDGSTMHGVEVIDSDKMLDMTSTKGRYSAMVPLFQELKSFNQLTDFRKRLKN